jgi:NitT/TauT family transport system substrate-binding protein
MIRKQEEKMPTRTPSILRPHRIGRRGFAALGAAALAGPLLPVAAFADDKVVFRMNWRYYGSHEIFFLGVQKGYYSAQHVACDIKSGNGSGAVVRLVANKDSTFAYASAITMIQLAAQGAPVVSIATIDAEGTDSVLVNPDSGIKTFKDLEGKRVLTTAGAGVNTLFPVACKNAGVDITKIRLTNVSENALVPSYLRGLAPAILGGMDDKPAEIEANGGKPPIIFNYADYGVAQPGYAIVAHKEMVASNPDLCKRFVLATIEAVNEAKNHPEEAIAALTAAQAIKPDPKEMTQARKVLDVTLAILYSKANTAHRLGLNVPADWASALTLLETYQQLKTTMQPTDFYTNDFVPTSV